MQWIREHKALLILLAGVLLLTALPALEINYVLGDSWRGILPTFTDELNFARVHTIGEGHLTVGNAYYLEHSDGPSLVVFGGAWINAIPLLLGIPLTIAFYINFILWSVAFSVLLYWLFRELRVSARVAALGTLFLYVASYVHVWRPVNMQPVYPFYFLFYMALLRLIREQNKSNMLLLGCAVGTTFYLLAYLWQVAVVTLGLLLLWALFKKDTALSKATFFSLLLGGVIGSPALLYSLWLSHTSPYFWESVGRLGLVNTHLPMAEVVYSGGWVGLACAFLGFLYWRVKALHSDKEFNLLALFLVMSGFGLWIMQGSNLITGKLLETGEHIRILILPWLAVATVSIGVFVWSRRMQFSKQVRLVSVGVLSVLSVANIYFGYQHSLPFLAPSANRDMWETEQLYAGPFTWLQNHEEKPVVVWSDPHDYLAANLPIFTRHFTLDTYWGMLELVPENEIRERYLVSQYFNNPTAADLASDREMALYLGRHDYMHEAKTIERKVTLCKLVFFWKKDCGVPPTPQSLLGEQFFLNLEKKFQTDIKPHIKDYLRKYHVSYILKDKVLDPTYHPEVLGATRVYVDSRYELYRL